MPIPDERRWCWSWSSLLLEMLPGQWRALPRCVMTVLALVIGSIVTDQLTMEMLGPDMGLAWLLHSIDLPSFELFP